MQGNALLQLISIHLSNFLNLRKEYTISNEHTAQYVFSILSKRKFHCGISKELSHFLHNTSLIY